MTGVKKIPLRAVKEYEKSIEYELVSICGKAIDTIDNNILPYSSGARSWISHNKMKGDIYKFLAEMKTRQNERTIFCHKSLDAYEMASELAEGNLPVYDALRLAVELNRSIFYYEIMGSRERAFEIATKSYKEASCDLSFLEGEAYTETSFMIKLLLDYIELWEDRMVIAQNTKLFRLVSHTPPKERRMPPQKKTFKDNFKACDLDVPAPIEPPVGPNVQDTELEPAYCKTCELSKVELNISKVEGKIEETLEDSTVEKLQREIQYLRNLQAMLLNDDEEECCGTHGDGGSGKEHDDDE